VIKKLKNRKLIEIGQRVIDREAKALSSLSVSLNESFSSAVALILSSSGRVIVSGMGKSGHIARKIAATMASTGTPAHFVHPAEASHGDLGMIVKGDVVIILSNSGETPELANLIAYSRKCKISMIGIAQNQDSTLLRKTDISIVLPEAEEACESGVVPTTSTTMTLALGDALAIALMETKNFTNNNFREFHPGGKLGVQLSRAKDVMHTKSSLPLTEMNTPMAEVLITMSKKGFGIVGVIDGNGTLLGTITDGDLRRNMDTLLSMCAKDVMTLNPKVIGPTSLLVQSLEIMNKKEITCLFIVDKNKPVGILHIHDCLRAGLN